MKLSENVINKNPKTNWYEYEVHESEPKRHWRDESSPELDDELLEYGIFLKHRVWRNMKKIRRHNSRVVREGMRDLKPVKLHPINHHMART